MVPTRILNDPVFKRVYPTREHMNIIPLYDVRTNYCWSVERVEYTHGSLPLERSDVVIYLKWDRACSAMVAKLVGMSDLNSVEGGYGGRSERDPA